MAIDVFGDLHGHTDALEELLGTLGYAPRNGAWRHPTNVALFLGDLIDRGPRQVDAVDVPRRMRDAGTAEILMGNHEFNAIAYATADGEGHLRERDERHALQHAAFVDAFGLDGPAYRDAVEFFATLPLWVETRGMRAVHACWSARDMAVLKGCMDGENRLTEAGFRAVHVRGSPAWAAAETILKGPEMALPPGLAFLDAAGHRRTRARLRWWDRNATTYRTASELEGEAAAGLPDTPLPDADRYPYDDAMPLFFGHYWLRGEPTLQGPRRACLDFSVAKGGVLCSYRYDGEPDLDPRNLTWVGEAPVPGRSP